MRKLFDSLKSIPLNLIVELILVCDSLGISKFGIEPNFKYPPVVWESFNKIIGCPLGGNWTVPKDTPEDISSLSLWDKLSLHLNLIPCLDASADIVYWFDSKILMKSGNLLRVTSS